MRIALAIPFSSKILKSVCNAFTKLKEDFEITHISTDSRITSSSDLFFSLANDKDSALQHLNEAKRRGALTISPYKENTDFLVSDTYDALLKLASFYKNQLTALRATIALTGSVGKTTTKDFTAAVIGASLKTHKTPNNFNNALGVALTILTSPRDTEILVLELGMNGLGEIKKLSETVKPDIAAITNVGSAHIGLLGSRALIAKAKLEITAGMSSGKIIVPFEEPLLASEKIKLSLTEKSANCYLETRAGIQSFYLNGKKLLTFSTAYKAKHHLSALAYAISLAALIGLNDSQIMHGICCTEKIVLRQRLIDFKDFSVFDDTYSSSYEAVQADLEYLMLEYPDRAISCAVGDMLELGSQTSYLHEKLGELIFKSGARKLYAFGSYAFHISRGAEASGMPSADIITSTDGNYHQIIASAICKNSSPGEIVLIKASHALRAEKIIEEIERFYGN